MSNQPLPDFGTVFRLNLIVVIVDISAVSVRTGVTWASGGVLVIVVLSALVSGASVVHPVRQVSLQPLVRAGGDKINKSTDVTS